MKTAPHPSLPFSLYFDEDAHRYLVDTEKSIEYWQPLPSVTQFVGHYIPPFDAQKAAAKKARFSDKTAEQILAEWDAKKLNKDELAYLAWQFFQWINSDEGCPADKCKEFPCKYRRSNAFFMQEVE